MVEGVPGGGFRFFDVPPPDPRVSEICGERDCKRLECTYQGLVQHAEDRIIDLADDLREAQQQERGKG